MTEEERKKRYERVKRCINRETQNQPDTMAMKESDLRTRFCANADMEPDAFNSVLGALAQNGDMVRGSGWITPNLDDLWLREAIEYVADREESPREFVAAVNREA